MMLDYLNKVFRLWSQVLLYIDKHDPGFVKENIKNIDTFSIVYQKTLSQECIKMIKAIHDAQKLVDLFMRCKKNNNKYMFFTLSNIVKIAPNLNPQDTSDELYYKYLLGVSNIANTNDKTQYEEINLEFINIEKLMAYFYKEKTNLFELEFHQTLDSLVGSDV